MGNPTFSYKAVLPQGVSPVEIEVDLESGLIESVIPASAPVDESLLLFPGFFDIHVHAREFPKPPVNDTQTLKKWDTVCSKEVFSSAGKAAINGGVTGFAAMPNDPTPPDNFDAYQKKASLSSQSECPTIIFASITERSEPWDELPYKVYLDMAQNPSTFSDWAVLEESLRRYKGRRVFFHAEDPDVLRKHVGLRDYWKRRPPEAEIMAVDKILDLTAKIGLVSHICHVSTARAVQIINEFNATASNKVSCEVTPHHLFFSVDEKGYMARGQRIDIKDYLLNSNPPIRSEEDRQYLLEALRTGTIPVLASDHAPHLLEEKIQGAPGMPHLDTLGPFAGWLIKSCKFSPVRIAQVFSEAPGEIMAPNLPAKHGIIKEGYCGSFTVLDMSKETNIRSIDGKPENRKLFTRCGWSPFEKISLPAYVRLTVINGAAFDYSKGM
jgi:dihydroorotase